MGVWSQWGVGWPTHRGTSKGFPNPEPSDKVGRGKIRNRKRTLMTAPAFRVV